ncbi:MAG: beta-CASP ribonuclease aCPSF1 [Candidatus Thermoplasmatota archaeon]|nr:beta-CASP ribonuclease aCPSF1 [Candidatus Thermoplasmatota archaeon]
MGYLDEITDRVRELIGGKAEITSIEFEGPLLAVYTKNPEVFTEDAIKEIAKAIKKRIVIRTDPALREEPERAEKEILSIVPQEAEVTSIFFQDESGEVIIEAKKSGVVIGKNGAILNEIRDRTHWGPVVLRTPPIRSTTIEEVRRILSNKDVVEERRNFLRRVGRKVHRDVGEVNNWVRTTALGGYREVGRSCTLLNTAHSKVLVDCGLNVSSSDDFFPYLNAPELHPLDSIDAVVITHAHLDHCGILPWLFKMGYDGPVYCTEPTMYLMALLQLDTLRVTMAEGRAPLYGSEDVTKEIEHCITVGYGETTDISPDLKMTLYNAGHILGSSMVHFNVGEGFYNVLFSGDYKYERTILFNQANKRYPRVEALIMESTYGAKEDIQPPRDEAVERLVNVVSSAIARGGKVMVPVFSVGRSQEVMLALESAMRNNEIEKTEIYLDGMIWEATAIHTAYPEYLNSELRAKIFEENNPFLSDIFVRVDSREMRDKVLIDPKPCIVLATAGMMNGGPILEYLKYWAGGEKNVLIFVGYQAEGTLGRRIQKGLREIQTTEGGKPITVKAEMDVETVDGFSGHSDRRQLMNYVRDITPKPAKLIVCHGDGTKSIELAAVIRNRFRLDTRIPVNLESVRLR